MSETFDGLSKETLLNEFGDLVVRRPNPYSPNSELYKRYQNTIFLRIGDVELELWPDRSWSIDGDPDWDGSS